MLHLPVWRKAVKQQCWLGLVHLNFYSLELGIRITVCCPIHRIISVRGVKMALRMCRVRDRLVGHCLRCNHCILYGLIVSIEYALSYGVTVNYSVFSDNKANLCSAFFIQDVKYSACASERRTSSDGICKLWERNHFKTDEKADYPRRLARLWLASSGAHTYTWYKMVKTGQFTTKCMQTES